MYILINKSTFKEYACVVVEEITSNGSCYYGLSVTDNLGDATKFADAEDAWKMLHEELKLTGWDVVEL